MDNNQNRNKAHQFLYFKKRAQTRVIRCQKNRNQMKRLKQFARTYTKETILKDYYNQLISGNKIIMKVNRQRNLYLRQIFSQEPHKYIYDLSKGKYSLINKEGEECRVSSNGILQPKFRPKYSGCVDNKIRLNDLKDNPASFYFKPDSNPQSRQNTLMPEKFIGYAQFPYSINPSPSHLKQSKFAIFSSRTKPKRSLTQKPEESSLQRSQIITSLRQQKDPQQFLTRAWGSITNTKPIPRQKKQCYNDRCKYSRKIDNLSSFKRKLADSRKLRKSYLITTNQILGKNFHEDHWKKQEQQLKRIFEISKSLQKKK